IGTMTARPVLLSSALVGALAVAVGAPSDPPPQSRGPEGELAFDVRDGRTGEPIPCKLTFVGVGGTATPAFTRMDIGRAEGDGVIAAFDRVMSVGGQGLVHVPHGSYDVYVSRGPEWDIAVSRAVKIGPARATVIVHLSHVIDSDGWASADFHVHAARSPDSI